MQNDNIRIVSPGNMGEGYTVSHWSIKINYDPVLIGNFDTPEAAVAWAGEWLVYNPQIKLVVPTISVDTAQRAIAYAMKNKDDAEF